MNGTDDEATGSAAIFQKCLPEFFREIIFWDFPEFLKNKNKNWEANAQKVCRLFEEL